MKRLAILLLCLLVCLPATGLGEDFLVSDAQETTAETDAGESIVDTLKGELSNAASFTAALAALDTGNLLDAVNAFTKLGSTYGADQYAAYAYALLLRLREEPAEAEEQLQTLSGFLDSDYQLALTRASQLHRFAQDGKYGYVGTDGAWSIAPQFDWAEQVFRLESVPAHDRGNTDYAPQELYMVAKVFVGQTEVGESDVVPLEGAYGLVRSDGVIAVPARYTDVLWAVDGFAAVTDGSACTLYDLVAAAPVGGQYEDIGAYAQGNVPVKQNGLWGYLNPETGSMLGQGYIWETALPFSEGLAGVSLEGKYGYIDLTGKTIIPLQYDGAASFSEGLAGARIGKRWGFINIGNELVIPQAYTEVKTFQSGLCAVARNSNWGIIDTAGTVMLSLKYDEVTDFDPICHRAWFRQNKLWGLVSAGGTVVVKPTWSFHDDFEGNTLCRVGYKNQYGFIDANGKTRITSTYAAASPFRAELAAVKDAAGTIRYVDKMQRGFTLETDVPVECLRGFIEARTLWETERTVTDENGEIQIFTDRHITYHLYDPAGTPIAVETYAAADAQP